MKVTVCRPGELGPAEMARWTELQAADPTVCHPFLSAAFARAADGVRPDVRVAVVEDDATVMGFWPYAVSARSGTARAVAPGHTHVEGVVGPAGAELPAEELLRRCGLAAWRFDHLVAPQVERLGKAVAASTPSWVVDLTGGLDAYRAWLRSAHRVWFSGDERRRRKLVQRQGGRFEVVGDHRTVDRLLDQKSAQCLTRGWRDPFAADWAKALVHATLDEGAGGFSARLGVQWVGERVGAISLTLRLLAVECLWVTVYDEELKAVAPGIALAYSMVEAAAADGVTHFDMGPGADAYKRRMANDSWALGAGVVRAPGWAGALAGARHAGTLAAVRWLAASPTRQRRAQQAVYRTRRTARRVVRARASRNVS